MVLLRRYSAGRIEPSFRRPLAPMGKKVRIKSTSAVFVWRALRNFAIVDFEENIEEMVETTREVGDETATRPAVAVVPGTRPATAVDERDGGDRWGNVYERRGVRI